MEYLLIIGAKSDIAKEIAKTYAENNYNLYLAGRNIEELVTLVKDIKVRAANVKVILKEFDITDFNSHAEFFNSLNPKPKGILIASGYMAPQNVCEIDFVKTQNTINVNYLGAVSILNIAAIYFEQQKDGFIIGISSVAGDRGRKNNYIYGSSKAAFSIYLSGLRNKLHASNVHVLTVKPGFVNTKMIKNLTTPDFLTAEPETVAKEIFHAQQLNKNILYTASIWRLIMLIIKIIPEWQFKKMNI
jgi:short-subunit dehydrogenase